MTLGLIRSDSFVTVDSRTYSTTFNFTEDPLSDNGNWINGQSPGIDWANMRCSAGKCWGLQNGSVHASDGTAILTGNWKANQRGQGTVYVDSLAGTQTPEVEIRLRSAITPNVNRGYEVSFSCMTGGGAYLLIVRWNGAYNDFTELLGPVFGAQYSVGTGDVIRGEISGFTISAYKNDVLMGSVTDTDAAKRWATGNPGIGHNNDAPGTTVNSQWGFTAFTATEL